VVAGPAGFLLHDDGPWLHYHPAYNCTASAPANAAADSIPNSSPNSAANTTAHNAAPKAGSASSSNRSSRPLQLRRGNLVLVGWRQAGLVLRPPPHLRWSTDIATSTS